MFINGTKVDNIKSKETKEFELPPDKHSLQLKVLGIKFKRPGIDLAETKRFQLTFKNYGLIGVILFAGIAFAATNTSSSNFLIKISLQGIAIAGLLYLNLIAFKTEATN